MHPQPVTPFGNREWNQAVILAAEIAHAVELRHAAKAAGQVVGPTVIGAAQPTSSAAWLGGDGRGTMATDVVKRPQNAFVVAHHENGVACDLRGQERAGLGDLDRK